MICSKINIVLWRHNAGASLESQTSEMDKVTGTVNFASWKQCWMLSFWFTVLFRFIVKLIKKIDVCSIHQLKDEIKCFWKYMDGSARDGQVMQVVSVKWNRRI